MLPTLFKLTHLKNGHVTIMARFHRKRTLAVSVPVRQVGGTIGHGNP